MHTRLAPRLLPALLTGLLALVPAPFLPAGGMISPLAGQETTAPRIGQTAPAPEAPPASPPARILLVGTYHFANPGLDVVQFEVDDVLTPHRQAEIVAVAEALAGFRPTRVAVEVEKGVAPLLDSLYQRYREGTHELARNETQQLGFRLAHGLDLAEIHPVDHGGAFPFGPVVEHVQRNDPDLAALVEIETRRVVEETHRRQRELTIGGILREMNAPENLRRDHGLYLRFAAVGADDGYPGAVLLSRWYERNLHIFANLAEIAGPGDRIVVIMGAGHAPILRQLIADHPGMELVDPLDHLPHP